MRLQIVLQEITILFLQEIASIVQALKYFARDGKYCAISQMFYKNVHLFKKLQAQIFCERLHILQMTVNVVRPRKCFTRLLIFVRNRLFLTSAQIFSKRWQMWKRSQIFY